MALTTRIKEYREMQDLKQSDLAELVGVRRETIVNLERGKYNPSLKLPLDFASVLHMTVQHLYTYDQKSRGVLRHYAKKPPLFPSQSLRGAD